jgi:single-stranded DNA-binding protein
MNIVALIGICPSQPTAKQMQGGGEVSVFQVQVANRKGEPDMIEVSAFGETASRLNQHLKPGMQVCVQGKIKSRAWKDKHFISVQASAVEFWTDAEADLREKMQPMSFLEDDIPF